MSHVPCASAYACSRRAWQGWQEKQRMSNLGVQSRVGGDGQAAQTCGVAAPVGCRCGSVRERVVGEMRATMAMAVLARACS